MKGSNHRRQDGGDPYRAGADAQLPGKPLVQRADFSQGMAVFQLHQLGAARQDFALAGQRDAIWQTLEQHRSDNLFQLLDGPRQGRLGDVERPGRGCDIAAFGGGQKLQQQA